MLIYIQMYYMIIFVTTYVVSLAGVFNFGYFAAEFVPVKIINANSKSDSEY